MSDLASLQSRLGYQFRDPALLQLALTHPSVAHEAGVPKQHNQRLEFLGDAVLQIALSRELYQSFPNFGEGPLTKARARLVNRHALAVHGRHLRLGEELVLSRGEELNGGRQRGSALADAFEAVVGAVFLDGGYEAAQAFILNQFQASLASLESEPIIANPKGELQELLQATAQQPPEYQIVSAAGPDHHRVFECVVLHLGAELARGVGHSKRDAESVAALNALNVLRPPAKSPAPETIPAPASPPP